MDSKYIHPFRGLIAFVAFTDLGTAFRAFVEKKCFLNEFSELDSSALPRIYGLYTVLQAIILIHCTLFIHYKPLISMGISALTLSMTMILSETLVFRSSAFDFRILLPCVLNGVTVVGLGTILIFGFNKSINDVNENAELLKKSRMFKKNVWNPKMQ